MHNSDSAALAAQVAMNTILAGDIGELTKGVNQDISLMWEGKLFGYFGIAGKRKQKGGSNGFSASMHQYWPILCCLFLHMCLLLIRKKPLISFYHVCHSKGGSFRR